MKVDQSKLELLSSISYWATEKKGRQIACGDVIDKMPRFFPLTSLFHPVSEMCFRELHVACTQWNNVVNYSCGFACLCTGVRAQNKMSPLSNA